MVTKCVANMKHYIWTMNDLFDQPDHGNYKGHKWQTNLYCLTQPGNMQQQPHLSLTHIQLD